MVRVRHLLLLAALALTACGESAPKQQSAGASPPIRLACTTPEQAGAKAQDVTRKLLEARQKGAITQDEYVAFNMTMSGGLRAWAEQEDLKSYCAALDRIVADAGLE